MKYLLILAALAISVSCYAETITVKGTIVSTQGHINPKCRVVRFKSESTGEQMNFRIAEVDGDDDVSSIILTGLIANRTLDIVYDPVQTTGCGTEPKILYVTLY